jgi:hypothetical protein
VRRPRRSIYFLLREQEALHMFGDAKTAGPDNGLGIFVG